VADHLLALPGRPLATLDAVDVGAGTGIWTRMVARRGPRRIVAVEPNDRMRAAGEDQSRDLPIRWLSGRAEELPLRAACCDLLTLASCLHWVSLDEGLREFHRVLREGGRLAALWNPRRVEGHPLLEEIEERVTALLGGSPRVSSGRSPFTDSLPERLRASGLFTAVSYAEGVHVERMTAERYVGLWRSVNDVRVQAGEVRFAEFIRWVEGRVAGQGTIEAPYLTRVWSATRS
jgi:SAM-dependent methyltransferase